jgi:hypothetical protein
MPYKDPTKHREAQARYMRENRARLRQERTDWFIALKSKPCTDCKKTYPHYVMEWDHVRGEKSMNVSNLLRARGKAVLLREIAKCDLVCRNCHAIRTYERQHST